MVTACIIKRWWQRQRLRLCNLSRAKLSLSSHNGQATLQSHWLEICWSIPEKYGLLGHGCKMLWKKVARLCILQLIRYLHTQRLIDVERWPLVRCMFVGKQKWTKTVIFILTVTHTIRFTAEFMLKCILLDTVGCACPCSFSRPLQKHTMVLSWYFAIYT